MLYLYTLVIWTILSLCILIIFRLFIFTWKVLHEMYVCILIIQTVLSLCKT